MIKPVIGFSAQCRCGKTGPFASNKLEARQVAVNYKWVDLYPKRTDDKTQLICYNCAVKLMNEG